MSKETKSQDRYIATYEHYMDNRPSGIEVRLLRRPDSPNVLLEWSDSEGKRRYRSARHPWPEDDLTAQDKVRTAAEKWAEELYLEQVGGTAGVMRETMANGGRVTWRMVLDLYEERRMPELAQEDARYYSNNHKHLQIARQVLPLDDPVMRFGASGLDRVVRALERGTIVVGNEERPIVTTGPKRKRETARPPAAPRTIRDILSAFGRFVEFAREETIDDQGRALIPFNPVLKLKHKSAWPLEPDDDPPMVSADRFSDLLEAAPIKEARNKRAAHTPKGYLRMLLLLGRCTGRRKNALRNLRMRAIVRDPEKLRQALAANRLPPEWADVWIHGAILWELGYHKQARRHRRGEINRNRQRGLVRGMLIPLTAELRSEMDIFMANHPGRLDPDACMFPNTVSPHIPVSEKVMEDWWNGLVSVAGVPVVDGEGWHALRRAFTSDRAMYPEKLVKALTGWRRRKTHRGQSIVALYTQYHAADWLACMELHPLNGPGQPAPSVEGGVRERLAQLSDDQLLALIEAAETIACGRIRRAS